ncbi:MAG: hypothetical protein VKO21_01325, partial [Candidatus Sericytochromatia bacterium]|nr:hypothetical protein [Candidatus Sericytochromatia bacterium]
MGLDPLQEPGSQYGRAMEPRRDNVGIEPEDPRWSPRDQRRQPQNSPEDEPAPGSLGGDRTRFNARIEDPFSILIREQVPAQETDDPGHPLPEFRRFGLKELDRAWGGLWPRCYVIAGPWPLAEEMLHQLAAQVARTRPVTHVSYHHDPRELTLRTLARLKASATGLDLARARALAEAFRPVRNHLRHLSVRGGDTPESLGRRLQPEAGSPASLITVDSVHLAPAGTPLPAGMRGLVLTWPA